MRFLWGVATPSHVCLLNVTARATTKQLEPTKKDLNNHDRTLPTPAMLLLYMYAVTGGEKDFPRTFQMTYFPYERRLTDRPATKTGARKKIGYDMY